MTTATFLLRFQRGLKAPIGEVKALPDSQAPK